MLILTKAVGEVLVKLPSLHLILLVDLFITLIQTV